MQRVFLAMSICVALGLFSEAHAGALTQKEISDGWILLFDGETSFGWSGANLHVAQINPGKSSLQLKEGRARSTTAFQEFELELEYSAPHKEGATLYLVPSNVSDPGPKTDQIVLPHRNGPTTARFRITSQRFVCVVITGTGGITEFPSQMRAVPAQPVNVVFESQSLNVHHIKLRPLNTKSLFNGKDLAGWREFPGKKSKIRVTDKGEIHLTDGPGDLQTVGKYSDFVLQLECISNGKHLNSGIFFRCRDNEYQNGYECQIRNEFTPQATQEYTIENYDPETHKLLSKSKIKSTAVDYGTGAIYRRVPARKAMAADGEWFGMTIVAQGNHFATWVGGVQVADWNDNRPRSDNARTGCKLEAGHISIQGHDPTTDLSFRNLRIEEFTPRK